MALDTSILAGKKAKAKKVTVVDLGKKSFSLHKGALHRALGIPEGQTIPPARLAAALKDKRPEVRRMAASAKGLEGMAKK